MKENKKNMGKENPHCEEECCKHNKNIEKCCYHNSTTEECIIKQKKGE